MRYKDGGLLQRQLTRLSPAVLFGLFIALFCAGAALAFIDFGNGGGRFALPLQLLCVTIPIRYSQELSRLCGGSKLSAVAHFMVIFAILLLAIAAAFYDPFNIDANVPAWASQLTQALVFVGGGGALLVLANSGFELAASERKLGYRSQSGWVNTLSLVYFPIGIWFIGPRVARLRQLRTT